MFWMAEACALLVWIIITQPFISEITDFLPIYITGVWYDLFCCCARTYKRIRIYMNHCYIYFNWYINFYFFPNEKYSSSIQSIQLCIMQQNGPILFVYKFIINFPYKCQPDHNFPFYSFSIQFKFVKCARSLENIYFLNDICSIYTYAYTHQWPLRVLKKKKKKLFQFVHLNLPPPPYLVHATATVHIQFRVHY